MKSDLKLSSAIKIRRQGYSLAEISTKLNISKSTASIWLRDVPLSYSAKERLEKRSEVGRLNAAKTRKVKARLLNQKYLNWAENSLAGFQVSPILARLFCAILYWAEGGKFTQTHLEFTNSDPKIIKTFLKFLRNGFRIDEARLRANIHIHEYHDEYKQRQFWSKITNIPLSRFNKSYLKPHTKKVIRENYPGCVRICLYSSDTARKVKALYTTLANI